MDGREVLLLVLLKSQRTVTIEADSRAGRTAWTNGFFYLCLGGVSALPSRSGIGNGD
jgi:hypothetical protein